jgi:SAM-dependent methyltransferase
MPPAADPMEEKRIVREGYNRIVDAYLATRSEETENIRLLEDLERRLPPGALILDAGCGAGVPVARRLARSFRVVGIDFAEGQLRKARVLVPRAGFACQDLSRLGFPQGTFDAVCSYYAVIHVPRREHADILRNFHRLLKPSGLALLCLGAEDLEADIEEDYLGSRMYWSHYDAKTNLGLMRTAGFSVIWSRIVADDTSPGSGHLFVLARKPQRV